MLWFCCFGGNICCKLCCVLHTFLQETSQHMWLVVVRDQPIICATGKILSPPSLENLFWHHANNSSSGKYTVIVSQKSCSEKSKSNHLSDTESVTPLPLQSKLKSSWNGQMSLPWILDTLFWHPDISKTLVIGNPSLSFIQEKCKYTLALEENQRLELINDEKMRN